MVDIRFEAEFKHPLPLKALRNVPGLEDMILLRRGNRLSVMPVTPQEYARIVELAGVT
jgi:predicted RNA-binding protein with PUA-like domain